MTPLRRIKISTFAKPKSHEEKSGSTKNDGLDLLLDTICNAFWSIIFISLLIVVISSDHSVDSTNRYLDSDEVQRRIRTAEADVKKLQQAVSAPTSNQTLTQSIASLETRISAAKDALEKAEVRCGKAVGGHLGL